MMQDHGVAAWSCAVMAAVAGCSAAGDAVGTLTLNLTGRGDSGAVYRLRDAIITVQGPSSTQVWNTDDDPDRTSLSADVEVGDYSALLHAGWRIERRDGSAAVTVAATLLSDNPAQFTVTAQHRTSVPLQFRVADDTVDLSQGYDLTIGVQETPLLAILNTSDRFPASIVVLPAGADGTATPLRAITGLSTQLAQPNGIAVANGQLVVASLLPPAIHVYPTSADGNVAPIRQITGVANSFGTGPFEVQVSGGEIYAFVDAIRVFPLGAAGHVAPTRTIEPSIGGNHFAIDHGELYMASISSFTLGIHVYPSTASGAQTPTRTLVTPDPALCPAAIAIHGGLIYAADFCSPRVVVLPQAASGTVDPVRVIEGPSTGLRSPRLVAIFGNELYVLDLPVDNRDNRVLVYPLDAAGDVAPSRTITGTALARPVGMAVF